MAQTGKRIALLDIARSLGIVSVIVGHVLILFAIRPTTFSPGVHAAVQVIYAFHMPLFFLLSGLMHRARAWPDILKGSLALILLTQISHIAGVLAEGVAGEGWASPGSVLRAVVLLGGFSIGVTWFLVSLAVVRVLAKAVLEGSPAARIAALGLAAASLVLSMTTEIRCFQIQTWWAGLAFYLVGARTAPLLLGRLAEAGGRRPLAIALAAIAAAAVTLIAAWTNRGCTLNPSQSCGSDLLYGHFMVRMIIGDYGFPPAFLAGAAAGSLTVLLVSALLARWLPEGGLAVFDRIGRNTLPLLLLNGFFLALGTGPLRAAVGAGYPGWLPATIAMAVVVLHLALLPLVIPVVKAVERLCARLAGIILEPVLRRRPAPGRAPDLP